MSDKEEIVRKSKWDVLMNDFIKKLQTVSQSYDQNTIFQDVCRIFSLSLRGALAIQKEEKDAIEDYYQKFVEKYGNDCMRKIGDLFAIVVEALEMRRTDFLGHIYEKLNATKKGFGQFLTPESVSRFMSMVTFAGIKTSPGNIIKICDPTCGAGILLIEGAEEFINSGGRQGDILLFADDLDDTACCITYTQFSLLGYAAIVRRMDSLANVVYEGPWYTIGYFAHAMPMRLLAGSNHKISKDGDFKDDGEDEVKEPANSEPINIRKLVQEEFDLG